MGAYSRYLCIALAVFFLLQGGQLQAKDSEALVEVAPGIYLRPGIQEEFSPHNRGHIANLGFIVGERAVAVIDSGSNYREGVALRKLITEITPLPIRYVILTHMHPDHSLGAAAFQQDDPVYLGHAELADALARRQQTYVERMRQILGDEAAGTRMVFPTRSVSVDSALEVDLGGRTLLLSAYPTAHTNNDLSIYDEQTGTLWLSDLLFVDRIPVIDGSLLGWLKLIEELSRNACLPRVSTAGGDSRQQKPDEGGQEPCRRVTRVVPGHGPAVSDWKTALSAQRRYLETVADGVRQVIRRGGTIPEAVASVGQEERHKWLLFEAFHGRNVTAAFAELEWE